MENPTERLPCIQTDSNGNTKIVQISRRKIADPAWMQKHNLIYQNGETSETTHKTEETEEATNNEAPEIRQSNELVAEKGETLITLELLAISRERDVVVFQDKKGNKITLNFNGFGSVLASTIDKPSTQLPPTEKLSEVKVTIEKEVPQKTIEVLKVPKKATTKKKAKTTRKKK